ncbi:TonB-dependent receptor [Pedobacter frigidisoli]|uniref:SusC/RagA family TonB-linked outer membrane protein n=1 Tax=Pedobacter frigidisoli TaxID=2530455 RepID=UPI00292CC87E|nr:TonB-dependent receptor [Pedobacter frigidisoli]
MSKIYLKAKQRGLVHFFAHQKILIWVALLLLNSAAAFAQTKSITGVVIDEGKTGIPGVSVSVKGTKTAVQTDANGKYKISATPADQLVFNYVGYTSQSILVGTKTTINVSLVSASTGLSDVVVVGYGTTKRGDLTGAVGSVNMRDFEKAPVKSFDQALAGRVAGVQVSLGDGQPGTVADIVIRGAGSITQDNSPLFVIDGFPSESSEANSISPSDIESIDVLKDASATAIYGARGSNGVVLITTKRGVVGAPKITYNAYYGLTKKPKHMELMDGYEYVKLIVEKSPTVNASYLANGVTLDDYKNVESYDLQDYIYQIGKNQNHDLAIRGGADKTTYSMSLNYNDQQGSVKNGGFKRYQGRLVLDQNISKKIKVGVNTNYSYSEAFGLQLNINNQYASANFLYSVWGYRPVTAIGGTLTADDLLNQLYDPEIDTNGAQDNRVNPLINLNNQQTKTKNTSNQTNGYGEYLITPKLKLRISAGFNNGNIESNIFNNSQTQSGSKYSSSGPNATVGNVKTFNLVNDNILTYANKFAKKHNVSFMVGYSTQSNKTSTRSITAKQIVDESMELDAIDMVPATNLSAASSSSTWKLQSFLARANYDYKGKYLLTASYRADGSSKFAPGNRWGYFPSASAAWKFGQEKFLKDVKWLSDAKLRLGYGESGNNRVGDFAYASQANLTNQEYWYSYNALPYQSGFLITAADNADLKWETNKQTNIGLDLSFLKKRIELTVDIYKRITEDLLLNALLPYASGIPSARGFKNVGSLENKGLEVTINTTNIQSKSFRWTSNFNISFNRNKILELTEGTNVLTAGSGQFFDTNYSSLSPYISVKGRSVGDMYGLVFDGVYQYSDFDKMPNGTYQLKSTVTTNGTTRDKVFPGDIKYKDLNGDLVVNADDYTIIGRGLPIHVGGFSNNFTYKNWDLNVFLQWSYGNNIINANRYAFEGGIASNLSLNQFASYANRWTPENQTSDNFRAGGMPNANYSSRVVEDGSYLRLKTLRLGYNFSQKVLRRVGMAALNLNVSAQNILTLTGYKGLDPESSARQSNLTPGFDYGTYPQARVVTFGLNATF